MSRLFRARERRGTFGDIPIPLNSQVGPGSASFARTDLRRAEQSLQKVAVWACVNLVRTIAEMLPLQVFTGEGGERQEQAMPSWMQGLGGDGFGLPDWCSQLVYSSMLRGNTVGIITDRDARSGRPTQIVLQHPDLSVPRRDLNGHLEWHISGQTVPVDQVWHLRVNPVPGQILGLSPIGVHALTIGTGIAAMRFGSQWFEDGAHPSGLLTTDKPLQKGQADTAKQRFIAALRGNREPLVLGGGWKYQAIQIKANESQFLETHDYTSAEVCRIFGPALAEVLGYKTGGSLTYQNIEQRSLDLLTYAADPWLVRIEQALTALLPRGVYVKYNRGALLRTDLLTRYQAHEVALRNRWKTVNEVRDLEDQGPVEWGDEPNFTTYSFNERVNVEAAETVDGPPTKPPPPTPDPAVSETPSGGSK